MTQKSCRSASVLELTKQASVWFGSKPPFRLIFQVAVRKTHAGIRIGNEPLHMLPEGSSVFLVEAGETLSLPETRFEWLNRLLESQVSTNI